jgi:hypothetical protein
VHFNHFQDSHKQALDISPSHIKALPRHNAKGTRNETIKGEKMQDRIEEWEIVANITTLENSLPQTREEVIK